MKEIFRFEQAKEGELDYFELYKSDILLMVPMEERRRFSLYLNRVYSAGIPIAGEMTLLRCDGTRAHVFGWVTKCVNEQGVEEFQSVCMDVTQRHRTKVAAETKRYLKALTDVYDKIFEFNISMNTVKCLHAHDSKMFKHFENVAMQTDEATEKWITDAVVIEDRDAVRGFFRDFCQKRLYNEESKPPQIAYRAKSSDGEIRQYTGVFIKLDDTVSFYCCRRVANQEENEVLRTENIQLREEMKELFIRFTDGLAAFEVSPDGLVKPLYASENVCEYFGYTKEEWLSLMENATPLENFVSYSDASYEEFAELLRKGEAEFTYYDIHTETEKRIKAICSQREAANTPRYVMLYSVENGASLEKIDLPQRQGVTIRTFGYFDVFVGERPIAFRNKKSKELFALLVDRKGGYIDSEEAISFLWEDEPVNSVILARYRKVALRLKNTLEEYGIGEIMETVDGKRRIVPERVQCDLFDYLSGKPEHAQLFKGSYLSNYSWAENTLGELISAQE
jgi:PAS domain-containing protein